MFISSAIIVCLYFGGYNFPFINSLGLSHNVLALLGMGIFFAKIFFFIFFFMWIRWTIPRFRYDQLMKMGWNVLIPLAIINIVLTAGYLLWKNDLWTTSFNLQ
jgi:NADH-quinone oxidoreductase subunit H